MWEWVGPLSWLLALSPSPVAVPQELLAALQLSPSTELAVTDAGPDPRLLAAARVLLGSAAQLAGARPETLAAPEPCLPAAREAAALRLVAGVLAVALSQFSCGLEEDRRLLAGEGGVQLAGDEALAVAFRAEKKRLLAAALQRTSERVREAAAQAARDKAAAREGAGAKPGGKGGKGFGAAKGSKGKA